MVLAWGNTGQLGMMFAWVDKCVSLCWSLWSQPELIKLARLLLRELSISRAHATSIQHGYTHGETGTEATPK
jgi:hypothetical protein